MPGEVPNVELRDGNHIPQLGFGVWQIPDDEAQGVVETALEVGYRHIDTAAVYGNEAGVGRALRHSGIDRSDVFVTTKLRNINQGYDEAMRAFDVSATKLGIDVVDLYLIHWPRPAHDLYVDSWKALVRLQEEGRIRSIGVSNFHQSHLEKVIAETGITPAIDQIELHPYLQQQAMREFNAAHGIVTEAWSPLGQCKGLLDDPILTDIARRNGVTAAQTVLSWQLWLGNVVIPKSVTPSRIEENFAAVAVNLQTADLAAIGKLDRGLRYGFDPEIAEHD
ncbi:aldo/keto reductase [Nakamurella antarctica]|uniref:Aldo/keto reductase n=1 Tax=Nakamurella antarctica TaxID=1902245 RepID=A0A3G8ZZC4_9ACTN|nr:aldo/keto reductase [Nakamurella antarctica]